MTPAAIITTSALVVLALWGLYEIAHGSYLALRRRRSKGVGYNIPGSK